MNVKSWKANLCCFSRYSIMKYWWIVDFHSHMHINWDLLLLLIDWNFYQKTDECLATFLPDLKATTPWLFKHIKEKPRTRFVSNHKWQTCFNIIENGDIHDNTFNNCSKINTFSGLRVTVTPGTAPSRPSFTWMALVLKALHCLLQ